MTVRLILNENVVMPSSRGIFSLWVFFSGIPIRTTMDNATTVQYAGNLHRLLQLARSTIRDIDPTNELTFLRVRSRKHEIMIAPGRL